MEKFQCPYGHSLFFHSACGMRGACLAKPFQCPYGHSLFFHLPAPRHNLPREPVSMPLRAFFVFPRPHRPVRLVRPGRRFQCPYGHSLFFHRYAGHPPAPQWRHGVSMPLRAFFVFPHATSVLGTLASAKQVSMPLRAFFVFPPTSKWRKHGMPCCFNALTGILCFSTEERCVYIAGFA